MTRDMKQYITLTSSVELDDINIVCVVDANDVTEGYSVGVWSTDRETGRTDFFCDTAEIFCLEEARQEVEKVLKFWLKSELKKVPWISKVR